MRGPILPSLIAVMCRSVTYYLKYISNVHDGIGRGPNLPSSMTVKRRKEIEHSKRNSITVSQTLGN
ncbi:hypothetical protein HanRHA438_Chr16g0759511 [Helianthus annuus]|nr:hypothetical protein HanRHA438_Chr16g0759511 [Helianthus annuus]